MTEITTSTGTIIRLGEQIEMGGTLVVLDHPAAPDDMRNREAGRVIDGGFQPAPFAAFTLSPETLRAIAELVESVTL